MESEEKIGVLEGITRKNGGLDGSTVSNEFVRVDALVGLLAVEEVGDKLDDTWDTSGATNQDDLMDVSLIDLGVTKDLLDWVEGASEKILAQLLKTGTSRGGVEIDTFEERVDFDGSGGGGGKSSFGTLAGGTETTESTWVGGKIESGDVSFTDSLLVETVGDGSGSWLVDNTKDVQTADGAGVLSFLTLRVVEVGGDGNDGVGVLIIRDGENSAKEGTNKAANLSEERDDLNPDRNNYSKDGSGNTTNKLSLASERVHMAESTRNTHQSGYTTRCV